MMREIKKQFSYADHTVVSNVIASREIIRIIHKERKRVRERGVERGRENNKTTRLHIKHSLLFGYLHALVLLSVKDLKSLTQLHNPNLNRTWKLCLD